MTDAQYEAKFKEMQKYIPFIQKVIEKLKVSNDQQGDNPRKAQLQKMEMLHGLLTNQAKKLKMETLLKCEGVLIKLHAKIEKNEDPEKTKASSQASNTTATKTTTANSTKSSSGSSTSSSQASKSKTSDTITISAPASPSPERVIVDDEDIQPVVIPTERRFSPDTVEKSKSTDSENKSKDHKSRSSDSRSKQHQHSHKQQSSNLHKSDDLRRVQDTRERSFTNSPELRKADSPSSLPHHHHHNPSPSDSNPTLSHHHIAKDLHSHSTSKHQQQSSHKKGANHSSSKPSPNAAASSVLQTVKVVITEPMPANLAMRHFPPHHQYRYQQPQNSSPAGEQTRFLHNIEIKSTNNDEAYNPDESWEKYNEDLKNSKNKSAVFNRLGEKIMEDTKDITSPGALLPKSSPINIPGQSGASLPDALKSPPLSVSDISNLFKETGADYVSADISEIGSRRPKKPAAAVDESKNSLDYVRKKFAQIAKIGSPQPRECTSPSVDVKNFETNSPICNSNSALTSERLALKYNPHPRQERLQSLSSNDGSECSQQSSATRLNTNPNDPRLKQKMQVSPSALPPVGVNVLPTINTNDPRLKRQASLNPAANNNNNPINTPTIPPLLPFAGRQDPRIARQFSEPVRRMSISQPFVTPEENRDSESEDQLRINDPRIARGSSGQVTGPAPQRRKSICQTPELPATTMMKAYVPDPPKDDSEENWDSDASSSTLGVKDSINNNINKHDPRLARDMQRLAAQPQAIPPIRRKSISQTREFPDQSFITNVPSNQDIERGWNSKSDSISSTPHDTSIARATTSSFVPYGPQVSHAPSYLTNPYGNRPQIPIQNIPPLAPFPAQAPYMSGSVGGSRFNTSINDSKERMRYFESKKHHQQQQQPRTYKEFKEAKERAQALEAANRRKLEEVQATANRKIEEAEAAKRRTAEEKLKKDSSLPQGKPKDKPTDKSSTDIDKSISKELATVKAGESTLDKMYRTQNFATQFPKATLSFKIPKKKTEGSSSNAVQTKHNTKKKEDKKSSQPPNKSLDKKQENVTKNSKSKKTAGQKTIDEENSKTGIEKIVPNPPKDNDSEENWDTDTDSNEITTSNSTSKSSTNKKDQNICDNKSEDKQKPAATTKPINIRDPRCRPKETSKPKNDMEENDKVVVNESKIVQANVNVSPAAPNESETTQKANNNMKKFLEDTVSRSSSPNAELKPQRIMRRRCTMVSIGSTPLVDRDKLLKANALMLEDVEEREKLKRKKEEEERQTARRNKHLEEMFQKTDDNCTVSTQNIITGKRRTRASINFNETQNAINVFKHLNKKEPAATPSPAAKTIRSSRSKAKAVEEEKASIKDEEQKSSTEEAEKISANAETAPSDTTKIAMNKTSNKNDKKSIQEVNSSETGENETKVEQKISNETRISVKEDKSTSDELMKSNKEEEQATTLSSDIIPDEQSKSLQDGKNEQRNENANKEANITEVAEIKPEQKRDAAHEDDKQKGTIKDKSQSGKKAEHVEKDAKVTTNDATNKTLNEELKDQNNSEIVTGELSKSNEETEAINAENSADKKVIPKNNKNDMTTSETAKEKNSTGEVIEETCKEASGESNEETGNNVSEAKTKPADEIGTLEESSKKKSNDSDEVQSDKETKHISATEASLQQKIADKKENQVIAPSSKVKATTDSTTKENKDTFSETQQEPSRPKPQLKRNRKVTVKLPLLKKIPNTVATKKTVPEDNIPTTSKAVTEKPSNIDLNLSKTPSIQEEHQICAVSSTSAELPSEENTAASNVISSRLKEEVDDNEPSSSGSKSSSHTPTPPEDDSSRHAFLNDFVLEIIKPNADKQHILSLLSQILSEDKLQIIKSVIDSTMKKSEEEKDEDDGTTKGLEGEEAKSKTRASRTKSQTQRKAITKTIKREEESASEEGEDNDKEEDNDEEDDGDNDVSPSTSLRSSKSGRNTPNVRKKRNELDRLNEDIRDMFICEGVLTATGKRMCTLMNQRNRKTEAESPPNKRFVQPSPPVVVKTECESSANKRRSGRLKGTIKVPTQPLRRSLRGGKATEQSDNGNDDEVEITTYSGNRESNDDDLNAADSNNDTTPTRRKMPVLKPHTPIKLPEETEVEILTGDNNNKRKSLNKPCPKSKKAKLASQSSTKDVKKGSEIEAAEEGATSESDNENEVETDGEEEKSTSVELDTIKNTNVHWHNQSKYTTWCMLCSKKIPAITSSFHYKIRHRENYISRLAPILMQKFKQGKLSKPQFGVDRTPKQPSWFYRCPFCLQYFNTTLPLWLEHFQNHTAEFRYECSKCHWGSNRQASTKRHVSGNCKGATIINSVVKLTKPTVIKAHVCHLCNFLQIKRSNLERHYLEQHQLGLKNVDLLGYTIILFDCEKVERVPEDKAQAREAEAREIIAKEEQVIDVDDDQMDTNEENQAEKSKDDSNKDESDNKKSEQQQEVVGSDNRPQEISENKNAKEKETTETEIGMNSTTSVAAADSTDEQDTQDKNNAKNNSEDEDTTETDKRNNEDKVELENVNSSKDATVTGEKIQVDVDIVNEGRQSEKVASRPPAEITISESKATSSTPTKLQIVATPSTTPKIAVAKVLSPTKVQIVTSTAPVTPKTTQAQNDASIETDNNISTPLKSSTVGTNITVPKAQIATASTKSLTTMETGTSEQKTMPQQIKRKEIENEMEKSDQKTMPKQSKGKEMEKSDQKITPKQSKGKDIENELEKSDQKTTPQQTKRKEKEVEKSDQKTTPKETKRKEMEKEVEKSDQKTTPKETKRKEMEKEVETSDQKTTPKETKGKEIENETEIIQPIDVDEYEEHDPLAIAKVTKRIRKIAAKQFAVSPKMTNELTTPPRSKADTVKDIATPSSTASSSPSVQIAAKKYTIVFAEDEQGSLKEVVTPEKRKNDRPLFNCEIISRDNEAKEVQDELLSLAALAAEEESEEKSEITKNDKNQGLVHEIDDSREAQDELLSLAAQAAAAEQSAEIKETNETITEAEKSLPSQEPATKMSDLISGSIDILFQRNKRKSDDDDSTTRLDNSTSKRHCPSTSKPSNVFVPSSSGLGSNSPPIQILAQSIVNIGTEEDNKCMESSNQSITTSIAERLSQRFKVLLEGKIQGNETECKEKSTTVGSNDKDVKDVLADASEKMQTVNNTPQPTDEVTVISDDEDWEDIEITESAPTSGSNHAQKSKNKGIFQKFGMFKGNPSKSKKHNHIPPLVFLSKKKPTMKEKTVQQHSNSSSPITTKATANETPVVMSTTTTNTTTMPALQQLGFKPVINIMEDLLPDSPCNDPIDLVPELRPLEPLTDLNDISLILESNLSATLVPVGLQMDESHTCIQDALDFICEQAAADEDLSEKPLTKAIDQQVQLKTPTTNQIQNIGYSQQSQMENSVKFYCLLENCSFLFSSDAMGLENHFFCEHIQIKWKGYCNLCQTQCLPNDQEYSISKEIKHMIEKHVNRPIETNSDSSQQSATASHGGGSSGGGEGGERPPRIKLRRMTGDCLSTSNSESPTPSSASAPTSAAIVQQPKTLLGALLNAKPKPPTKEMPPQPEMPLTEPLLLDNNTFTNVSNDFAITSVTSASSSQSERPLQIASVVSLNQQDSSSALPKIANVCTLSAKAAGSMWSQQIEEERQELLESAVTSLEVSNILANARKSSSYRREPISQRSRDESPGPIVVAETVPVGQATAGDYLITQTVSTQYGDSAGAAVGFNISIQSSALTNISVTNPELSSSNNSGVANLLGSNEQTTLSSMSRTHSPLVVTDSIPPLQLLSIPPHRINTTTTPPVETTTTTPPVTSRQYKCMANGCKFTTRVPVAMSDHLRFHERRNLSLKCDYFSCAFCAYQASDVDDYMKHSDKFHIISKGKAIVTTLENETPQVTRNICDILSKKMETSNANRNSCGGALTEIQKTVNSKQAETEEDYQRKLRATIEEIVTPTGLSDDKLYRCVIKTCRTQLTESTFHNHIMYHISTLGLANSNNYIYKCPHCSAQYHRPAGIKAHIRNHARNRYFCYLCDETSSNPGQMLKHFSEKHWHTLDLFTKELLMAKVVTNPDGTEKVQDSCYYLAYTNDLSDSEIRAYGEKLILEWQRKKSGSKTHFKSSEIDLLPIPPIFQREVNCGECEYKTKVRTNMYRHLLMHKQNAQLPSGQSMLASVDPVNPVPCLNSSEKFFDKMTNLASSSLIPSTSSAQTNSANSNKMPYKIPQMYIPEANRFKCGISDCNYVTISEDIFRSHLSTLHGSVQSYRCPFCQEEICKRGMSADRVLGHLRFHSSILYRCEECNYLHYQRYIIERHINDKHATSKVNIVRHERTGDNLEGTSLTTCFIGKKYKDSTDTNQSTSSITSSSNPTVTETNTKSSNNSSTSSASNNSNSKGKGKWLCDICKHKAATLAQIQTHCQNAHGQNKAYQCIHCQFGSQQLSQILFHIDETHPGKARNAQYIYHKMSSDVDGDVADTRPLWQRNDPTRVRHIRGILMEDEEESEKHRKKLGLDKANADDDIEEDDEDVTEEPSKNNFIKGFEFGCFHCDYKSEKFDELYSSHYKHAHSSPLEMTKPFMFRLCSRVCCPECRKFTGNFYEMQLHLRNVHYERTFYAADISMAESDDNSQRITCAYCNFHCLKPDQLLKHFRSAKTLHSPQDIHIENQTQLQDILKLGSNQTYFQCTLCNQIFGSRVSIVQHAVNVHANDEGFSFKELTNDVIYHCTHCSFSSTTEATLLRHMTDHYGRFKHCNFCHSDQTTFERYMQHCYAEHRDGIFNFRDIYPYAQIENFLQQMLVLFPNGLVVSKLNLLKTSYGSDAAIKENYANMYKMSQQPPIPRLSIARLVARKSIETHHKSGGSASSSPQHFTELVNDAASPAIAPPASSSTSSAPQAKRITKRRCTVLSSGLEENNANNNTTSGVAASSSSRKASNVSKRKPSLLVEHESSSNQSGEFNVPIVQAMRIKKRRRTVASDHNEQKAPPSSPYSSSGNSSPHLDGADVGNKKFKLNDNSNAPTETSSQPQTPTADLKYFSFYGIKPEPLDFSKIYTKVAIGGINTPLTIDKFRLLFNIDCQVKLTKFDDGCHQLPAYLEYKHIKKACPASHKMKFSELTD